MVRLLMDSGMNDLKKSFDKIITYYLILLYQKSKSGVMNFLAIVVRVDL